ncbi:hypothetical protein W04_0947 [Pseudoalteromonas sp. SW0106-04]|nr:hypothetical protein W04_0947 [Pseudoalteromonas sp. SW0106-04]
MKPGVSIRYLQNTLNLIFRVSMSMQRDWADTLMLIKKW